MVRCAQVRAGVHCEDPSKCPDGAKRWLDTCETPELFTIDVGMSSGYPVRQLYCIGMRSGYWPAHGCQAPHAPCMPH